MQDFSVYCDVMWHHLRSLLLMYLLEDSLIGWRESATSFKTEWNRTLLTSKQLLTAPPSKLCEIKEQLIKLSIKIKQIYSVTGADKFCFWVPITTCIWLSMTKMWRRKKEKMPERFWAVWCQELRETIVPAKKINEEWLYYTITTTRAYWKEVATPSQRQTSLYNGRGMQQRWPSTPGMTYVSVSPGQQPADQLPLLITIRWPVPLNVLVEIILQQVAAVFGIHFCYLKHDTVQNWNPLNSHLSCHQMSCLDHLNVHLWSNQHLSEFKRTKTKLIDTA